eukprot:3619764-Pyramimonas_sp.AAC.1
MERDSARLREQVNVIRSSLALAERQLGAADLAKLAECDREADPLLFTANCQSMASGPAVRAALEDWIVAAKVRSEFIEVVGGAVPAKRFFVH